MKKIIFIFLVFLITIFISASEKKNLNDFINDADNIAAELAKVTAELNNQKIKYEEKIKKIEILKNKKSDFFLENFINGLLLKYYLGNANNLAFKISNLTKKHRELNNDYFTIVSLILTEYGEKIRNCIKNKCKELKKLYVDRIKWLDIVKNYENYIGVDLAFDIFEKNYDEKSKKDLVEYLEKKLIQIDQRIYILEDEIKIDILLKNNGFKTDDKKIKEINEKIKELKNLKYVLKEKINEFSK
ncbi:MAG: hypothetical protein N3E50_09000 [Candidatus Goldbacteria bacterium]|nr:hypothetical protein [Candidatus Goldiibacteriota bacterium]